MHTTYIPLTVYTPSHTHIYTMHIDRPHTPPIYTHNPIHTHTPHTSHIHHTNTYTPYIYTLYTSSMDLHTYSVHIHMHTCICWTHITHRHHIHALAPPDTVPGVQGA